MNTHNDTHAHHVPAAAPRARRRWTIAAVLAVAVGTACASYANGVPGVHGHHAQLAMNPDALKAHFEGMVEHCAADASSDQKARLASIATAAAADLRPAHEQFRGDHARAHALLMAPAIDRAALEQWRVEHVQHIDFISRRLLAAMEDGAEVLTPEQRAKCAGRMGMPMH
jgi:Spy/CpxP family protein refolding chaperone